MSDCTLGSAFSLMVRPAVVCAWKMWQTPSVHPALAHQFLNLAGYVDQLGPLLGAHAQGVDHAHLRMSPASPGEAIRPDGVAGSRGGCIS